MTKTFKILIVEDEIALSSALKEKLTLAGYKTYRVNDGEKGLNAAFNIQPDGIILDLIMPNMGGVEMLKKLRKLEGCKNIPVVVLTNVANASEIASVDADPKVWSFVKSDTSLADIISVLSQIINGA